MLTDTNVFNSIIFNSNSSLFKLLHHPGEISRIREAMLILGPLGLVVDPRPCHAIILPVGQARSHREDQTTTEGF